MQMRSIRKLKIGAGPTAGAADLCVWTNGRSILLRRVIIILYVAFMLSLLTSAQLQSQAIYLHAVQMTLFKDLNVPEAFDFLKNQIYRRHERFLVALPSGFVSDITSCSAFQLLHDDPEACLVIHMHAAAGNVASGHRIPNFCVLYSASGRPDKIHILAFDYRGFGASTGTPSEHGLILDEISIVK
ncbi:hypothetical protein TSTA_020690 [Talaromyces stipitatus ATCC 10500]|uniref:Serine aminopeptidase S33 domain-containing protein n=1 Tax=Talaromyces stipitatus (strain ATCC 10500 / CBS 375.48 / QM 6759 / NRRL 1006) TaxID=441959 RepID=B8MFM2_TALSN|nr:uncharacterized protein TSTA_020690 [Talaromyces stipitatus ATCC 10500]EED17012.1 hypothetical protein TSTA_020690 [Talaromyces stipitatus ATCC 10500]